MRVDVAHLVIAAADKAAATALAMAQNPTPADPAVDPFPVPLSPTGAAPATHWCASVPVTEAFRALLPTLATQLPGSAYFLDSEGHTRASVLEQLGLQYVGADA